MAADRVCADPEDVSETLRTAGVTDLQELRLRNEQVVAEVAAAPVRHLPAALLEALQGSWGTPEELGLAPTPERRLRVVAG
jgi:hypothetical protein